MAEENPVPSTSLPRQSLGGSSSSSIRKRSLIIQTRETRSRDEDGNDDDGERSSLLASERAVPTSTPSVSSPTELQDMSLTPQREHFQGCLKLFAENKINKDNAWNLRLIDFMSTMLKRHDARMDNLQLASTVVDASARIYSFRVDSVHYDVLKMAGGLSKVAQSKRGKKDDDAAQGDGAADGEQAAAPVKKKKKRSKGAIAKNPETLNGDFEVHDCVDPFFERLAAIKGDVMASNKAFNANLPVDDKTLGLVLSTEGDFLESMQENIPEDLVLNDRITLPKKLLPAFTDTDEICEPFTGFSIANWDPETEDTQARVADWVEENRLNLSQQALAFDVNAEVEPIPQDEERNDLFVDEPLGGIESDEEADVAVAACVARLSPTPIARLTDMRPSSVHDTRLEYSYSGAIVTAWAGPSHWKLKNNRASKMTERTGHSTARLTVDGTSRKSGRSKKQLDFVNVGIAFDYRANPTGEYVPAQPNKIMISRKTLATANTWNEEKFKTPVNQGLDESHFRKLFLRPSVMMPKRVIDRSKQQQTAAPAEPLAVDDVGDYDYNNENDASFCVNNAADGDEKVGEAATAAVEMPDQVKPAEPEELGEMIEPPAKIPRIFIPYALRAKKVDMKQLKHRTWEVLTENTPEGEQEDVKPTTFSNVYSRLPSKLSNNSRESLSVPLALLSVLHLANEKGLILEKREDLKDFDIVGLLK